MEDLTKSQLDEIEDKISKEQDPLMKERVEKLLALYHSSRKNKSKTSAVMFLLHYLKHGVLLTEVVSFIQDRSMNDLTSYGR
jgi:hypothetical protein